MVASLSTLTIESLIFHQVPRAARGSENPDPLTLSLASIDMKDDQRLYMQERLRSALSPEKLAREVQEASPNASPVPDQLRNLLLNQELDYVAPSHTMASHLRSVQDGGSPNGLFMFGRCSWGGFPSLIIAKLELERGLQVTQVHTEAGLPTYDLSLLSNLVFGQASRIYKVGLFTSDGMQGAQSKIHGLAVDEQKPGAGVSKLFLLDFLGCEYVEDSAELTRKFYELSSNFFSTQITAPEKKSRYLVALVSELESRKNVINIPSFLTEHLDDEDQDIYKNFLNDKGLHRISFSKSLDYVSTSMVRYETDTNVIIISPPNNASNEVIQVKPSTVLIKGKVKKVATSGGNKRKKRSEATQDDSQGGTIES